MTDPDCYFMSCRREKIKIKIVCPALVGGKKKNLGKVDHVIENLENFLTNYTDFMVSLVKKNTASRKKICHVGGKNKNMTG